MKRVLCVFIASLFVCGIFPIASSFASDCAEQREQIGGILQTGTVRIRRLIDEIQNMSHLSVDTKEDFRQSAKWVLAWSQDQHAQIDRKKCDEISHLVTDIRAQWEPLQLKVWKVRTIVVLWHLDQILFGETEMEEDVREMLTEAEELFVMVRDSKNFQGAFPLRRAAFLTRQGLRLLKNSSQ